MISDGKVLAVTAAGAAPFLNDHLDAPVSIALDAAGNIYVANTGKAQNVAVFSPAGKYLRSIGTPGGRPAVGAYQSTGMLAPSGIAVDKTGALWVAETLDHPKRISAWNTRTGKCVRELFGGSEYATFVSMDPRHEDEAFCHMTEWKIDLDKGTWAPKSTMWRATAPNMIDATTWVRVLTAANGHQYAWGHSHLGSVLYLRAGDRFKPVLAAINVQKGNPFIPWPPYPIFSDNAKYPNGAYIWQDAHDDQIIHPEELAQSPLFGGFSWIDEHLNLWSETGNGSVLRPRSIDKDGRPHYDLAKVEKTGIAGGHEFGGLFCDRAGSAIYTIRPDVEPSFARWSPGPKLSGITQPRAGAPSSTNPSPNRDRCGASPPGWASPATSPASPLISAPSTW